VVTRGTATPIANSPIPIAGKTGTAEKPNLENGGYYKNRFIASFAGYFPADKPRVAGVVILDEPRPITYGGYTSAPTFMQIACKFAALDKYDNQYADYPVSDSATENYQAVAIAAVSVPDLVGQPPAKALYLLQKCGLKGICIGEGETVLYTKPSAFASISPEEDVQLFIGQNEGTMNRVPDLAGLTIREAVAVLSEQNVLFSLSGQGRIIDQVPQAGEPLAEGDAIKLYCRRGGDRQSSY
jgi:stage V sporulation protein D (sporulation-specific penicillin-binding protein)